MNEEVEMLDESRKLESQYVVGYGWKVMCGDSCVGKSDRRKTERDLGT